MAVERSTRVASRNAFSLMSQTRHQEELFQAISSGDLETIHQLLHACEELIHTRDDAGRALVHLAVESKQPDVLDTLLNCGCSFEDEDESDEESDTEQEEEERDKEPKARGSSALNLAIELGLVDCAKTLLAHGALPDAASSVDGMQQTSLHVAAMYDSTASGLLIQSAMDLNAPDLCANTPLHLAAAYGSFQVAQRLIEAGADVHAVNASSATPLHLAAPNGYDAIVALLLSHGAQVNAKDALGNTPLIDATFVSQNSMDHFACGDAQSQCKIIQLLLVHGADVDAVNRDGNPAISGAVRNGYTSVVNELLDRRACVTKTNRRDESVLHIAARAGVESLEIWTRLVDAGADVGARDRYDRTCFGIWISRPKVTLPSTPQGQQTPEDDEEEEEEQQEEQEEEELLQEVDEITRLLEQAMAMAA